MNNLTDGKIIKALECCKKTIGDSCCIKCPLYELVEDCTCVTELCKNALELINRQKAELQVCNETLDNSIKLNTKLQTKVKSLTEALKDLKRKMSYMSNPNTIGDRHEMGCW